MTTITARIAKKTVVPKNVDEYSAAALETSGLTSFAPVLTKPIKTEPVAKIVSSVEAMKTNEILVPNQSPPYELWLIGYRVIYLKVFMVFCLIF